MGRVSVSINLMRKTIDGGVGVVTGRYERGEVSVMLRFCGALGPRAVLPCQLQSVMDPGGYLADERATQEASQRKERS